MNQRHAGDDVMRATLQTRQHFLRLAPRGGLSENPPPQKHERVRTQNQRVWKSHGNRSRFAIRVQPAQLAG